MTGSGQEDHKERSVGEASGKKKIFLAYKKKHMTRTSLFSAFGSDQLIWPLEKQQIICIHQVNLFKGTDLHAAHDQTEIC